MHIYHNSHTLSYRSPFGAARTGTSVTLSLDVADVSGSVFLDCVMSGHAASYEMKPLSEDQTSHCNITRFSFTLPVGDQPGILWYSFRISNEYETIYYGNNHARLGGEGAVYSAYPVPFQITVYRQDHIPDWYSKGIVYQIFPDRFARGENWLKHQEDAEEAYNYGLAPNLKDNSEEPHAGTSCDADLPNPGFDRPVRKVECDWNCPPRYPRNDKGGVSEWIFSGGDLEGIQSRLSYLKNLGITVIYLNPVFKASSNHKYDTCDYLKIDETFGSEEDFEDLCRAAGDMGIRIILDGVFNHTGKDSIYFDCYNRFDETGASQGEASRYYPWYTFTENGYECWWGVDDLPNVNEHVQSYKDFIYDAPDSVVRKWLRLGASGWRLDVADELPDAFICGIRRAMLEEDPESLLLGEVWEDASNKESYGHLREYFSGYELQSTMNYPFRTAALSFMKGQSDAWYFAASMLSLKENYPHENFYGALNLIGSHDRLRILTELADGPEAIDEKIRDASAPLSPMEEDLIKRGISRSDAIKECWRIPEDKKWLAYNRLKAISLMQFVMPGVPCIYYGDEAGMQGFEDPYCRGNFPWGQEDPELETHFRFLCSLRKDYPVLTDGDFDIYALSEHVICIDRSVRNGDSPVNRIRLIVNRGIFEWEQISLSKTGHLSAPVPEHEHDLLTDKTYHGEDITLPPLGMLLLCS